jgi:hypothetical protein
VAATKPLGQFQYLVSSSPCLKATFYSHITISLILHHLMKPQDAMVRQCKKSIRPGKPNRANVSGSYPFGSNNFSSLTLDLSII